jgi:hypothetical protein
MCPFGKCVREWGGSIFVIFLLLGEIFLGHVVLVVPRHPFMRMGIDLFSVFLQLDQIAQGIDIFEATDLVRRRQEIPGCRGRHKLRAPAWRETPEKRIFLKIYSQA